jgi:predicted NBD/HSP70 family sugar kinase
VNKSSTVTRNGNEILRHTKLTIGMDLGDRSTRYCVLDEAGEVILERSVPTTKKGTVVGAAMGASRKLN